jgi:hypothetical protein
MKIRHLLPEVEQFYTSQLTLTGLSLCTLRSAPFVATGNGFFASYAGLFMAFQIIAEAFLEEKKDRV